MANIEVRDNRGGNWFWADKDLVLKGASHGLDVYAVAVYCLLACMVNNSDQSAFPSTNTIATTLGISERKVYDALSALEAENWIAREQRKRDNGALISNMYFLKSSPYAQHAGATAHDAGATARGADDQYTDNKTIVIKGEDSGADAPKPEPVNYRDMFGAFLKVCYPNGANSLPPNLRSRLGKLVKGWCESGLFTPADVEKFGAWWYANDWRGKTGQPPKAWQLDDLMASLPWRTGAVQPIGQDRRAADRNQPMTADQYNSEQARRLRELDKQTRERMGT